MADLQGPLPSYLTYLGAKICGMTAKELLVQRAPRATEEQAQRALEVLEAPLEPGAADDDTQTVWMPDSWRTFADGTPQPDWTDSIRADRDRGH